VSIRDGERTTARAIAASVNYLDTAVQYGNGESEKNLGRVLQNLKPANGSSAPRSGCRAATSAALPTLWRMPDGEHSIKEQVAAPTASLKKIVARLARACSR
jgi:predicted aldo/keto reductase-like oxidoreductase